MSKKVKGDFRPPSVVFAWEASYFFLPPAFFFEPPFFFAAMFSILPFPFSWMCGWKLKQTALDDCIDSLKIEVKEKMKDIFGSRDIPGVWRIALLAQNIPLFLIKKVRTPAKLSWPACAIMPGRKLFLHRASSPKSAPKTTMRIMFLTPS